MKKDVTLKWNIWNEKSKGFVLLILLFTICEIIVNPIGEFPLNDDWSYSKSVLNWLNDGEFSIGDFPAMTLFTHLVWGILFTKIAGFSFFVLRLSTIIMSLIGAGVLYHLVLKISNSVQVAFITAFVMLFNPIYFNLSNTYMTDITFNTFMLLCCYYAYSFFQNRSLISFVLVFIFSIFLILTRQLGIVLPICFLIACLGVKDRKMYFLIIGLVLTIVNIFILKYYENYLQATLPEWATYKFSGEHNLFSLEFWKNLSVNIRWRHSTILMHLLVYTLPMSIIYLAFLIRSLSIKTVLISATIVVGFTFGIFNREPFPMGNVFVNIGVGTRTFYEYLCATTSNTTEHAFSQLYEDRMHWVKLFLIALNLVVVVLAILKWRKSKVQKAGISSEKLFFLLLLLSYAFMLLIPGSYFDRYHIPIITCGLILFTYISKLGAHNYKIALPLILIMVYVSVAGTKDYFTINRLRWEAYNYLKNQKEVEPEKINGGFEVNCWNEGKSTVWYLFLELDKFDYLIQFSPEPDYKPIKKYPFQRYVPDEKDNIYIFANGKSLEGARVLNEVQEGSLF